MATAHAENPPHRATKGPIPAAAWRCMNYGWRCEQAEAAARRTLAWMDHYKHADQPEERELSWAMYGGALQEMTDRLEELAERADDMRARARIDRTSEPECISACRQRLRPWLRQVQAVMPSK